MSYYVDSNGRLNVKATIPEDVINTFQDAFPLSTFEPDCIDVYGNENYYEEDVFDALNKIAPYIEYGVIECVDEYHEFWRFVFRNGKVHLEKGHIVYDDSDA